MSMQDPIADMLTRIRNANMASLKEVSMPSSMMKASIAKVMKDEGYISDFRVDGEDSKKKLLLSLKYFEKKPVIEGLKRISKTSCRLYCGSDDIPRVNNGLGVVILSTPKGIISGKEAKQQNVGGEIICYVW
ncbi:MAG: 30S ribosomal protein S8 [Lentisphaerae bacterium GWF2_45_14]|nr:MAG: 30S ribosomal protein S8 [Lentisphaerae bacterium GWF2_45_14]